MSGTNPTTNTNTAPTASTTNNTSGTSGTSYANSSGNTNSRDEAQLEKERRVGITAYVNAAADGFSGVLKQRYTDFLVNEVLPDGRVLHLENLSPKKRRDGEGKGEGKDVEEEGKPAEQVKEEAGRGGTVQEESKDTEMTDAPNDVRQTKGGGVDGTKQEEGGSTNGAKQEAEEQQDGTADQAKVGTLNHGKHPATDTF